MGVERSQSPAASNDGDAYRFCRTCAFSAACLEGGYPKSRLRNLHVLVEHVGPFDEGEHIFREGERFRAVAAVRIGTVKTSITDTSGREQVLGFFLPGEVIGLNAISRSRYPCNVVALDAVSLSARRPCSAVIFPPRSVWRRSSFHCRAAMRREASAPHDSVWR